MSIFGFGRRRKKRPSVKRKSNRTRPYRKAKKPEELPSGTPISETETKVTATRSQAKQAREQMSGPAARPAAPEAPPKSPARPKPKATGTPSSPKGDRRTSTASVVGEDSTGVPKAKDNPTTVLEGQKRAKKRGEKVGTFIGKDGRKKAAVTKEELEKSGLSLRDYLNKQKGLTRRKDMKEGGVVKKTVKAKATKPKVRGAGIAKKGVRPCKMR